MIQIISRQSSGSAMSSGHDLGREQQRDSGVTGTALGRVTLVFAGALVFVGALVAGALIFRSRGPAQQGIAEPS